MDFFTMLFDVVWRTAVAGDVIAWVVIVCLVCLLVLIGLGVWDLVQSWQADRAEARWQKRRREHVAMQRMLEEERGLLDRAEARRQRLEWRNLDHKANAN